MAITTGIAWTDGTWNPWQGCVEYHEGCANCYARELAERFGSSKWGAKGPRVLSASRTWDLPLRCQREAEKSGRPFLLFTASMADVFEDYKGVFVTHGGEVLEDDMDAIRRRMFQVVDMCSGVVFQFLTKRHDRWRKCWPRVNQKLDVPRKIANAWVGVSASTQVSYDAIGEGLREAGDFCGGGFLSLEPLVGPIDLLSIEWWCPRCKSHVPEDRRTAVGACHRCAEPVQTRAPVRDVGWVIVGGESGRDARPYNLRWARQIIQQCREIGVPCFHKQLGSRPIVGGGHEVKSGPMEAFVTRHKKGEDPAEWPEDLRVREFPREWRR